MDAKKPTRAVCRKCGAILPGPIDVCPICYAEQSGPTARRGGYKLFLALGFLVAVLIGIVALLTRH
jgi:hypothetical protein